MEKNHTEQKTVEETIRDDVFCNKCGKSTKHGQGKFACYEGCRVKVGFGYGSNKDGDYETFDICDQCYVEFTQTFAHPPIKENLDHKMHWIFGCKGHEYDF